MKLKLEKYLNFLLFYANWYFQYVSSKKIDFKTSDILVGWAGFSYKSFKKSKNHNIIKILERGSSHIEFQKNILLEEYKKFNLEFKFDQKLIDKELEEYQLADYICVPSEFSKKTFIEKGFSDDKIIKIPYGVNLKNFYAKEKKDNIFRFIYVGTISIRKGIIYTLKAFEELNLSNAELLLVGPVDHDIKPFITEFKKNNKIKFLGHHKQNELVNFYNNSDVFVISSIEDGFAMVILQALACGLPIICSENSGGADLIKDGKSGFIVPIRDIEKLKNKMNYLYSNKKKLTMMREFIYKDKNNYSWEKYGEKVVSKYKSLCKNF